MPYVPYAIYAMPIFVNLLKEKILSLTIRDRLNNHGLRGEGSLEIINDDDDNGDNDNGDKNGNDNNAVCV